MKKTTKTKKISRIILMSGLIGILGLSACAIATQAGSGIGETPQTTDMSQATGESQIAVAAPATDAPQTAVAAQATGESQIAVAAPAWEDRNHPDFPEFLQFNGQIINIEPYTDDVFFVTLFSLETVSGQEIANGSETAEIPTYLNLYVDHNTMILSEAGLEVGMEFTAFYNRPVLTEEPQAGGPSRAVAFVGELPDGQGVLLDRFSQSDVTSMPGTNIAFHGSEGIVFLHISVDTEIVLQDGTAFDRDLSELDNRAMLIISDTLSDPAQIVPTKIVVLFEQAVHPILQLTSEDIDAFWNSLFDPETVQIVVDGEAIVAPAPFVNREVGHVMVPVAYIAEAVGYTVFAEGEDIVIGRGITFTIGVDSYHYGRMAAIQLGVAPEIHEGVVFVPMHFFGDVMPIAVYIMDGNIIVSSDVSFEISDGIEVSCCS